jgi:hypothetical protein
MSQCNIYATNPMLSGVKTDYDLMMNQKYCVAAQMQPYGPNFAPAITNPPNNKICPFKPLSNAYQFSGAPSAVNRKPAYNL